MKYMYYFYATNSVMIMLMLTLFAVEENVAAESNNGVWAKFPGLQVKGLTQVAEATLEYCMRICFYHEHCNAISYDRDLEFPCWIQAWNSTITNLSESKESVTTYFLDKSNFLKPSEHNNCWTTFEDTTVKGLVPYAFNHIYMCLLHCLGSHVCEYITFDLSSTNRCWIEYGILGTKTEKDFVHTPGANSYKMNFDCAFPIDKKDLLIGTNQRKYE